jgi:hypothetical protein
MRNVRIAEGRRALFIVYPAQESTVGVPHVLSKPTSTIPSTTFSFGMASSTSLLPYGTIDIQCILAKGDILAPMCCSS